MCSFYFSILHHYMGITKYIPIFVTKFRFFTFFVIAIRQANRKINPDNRIHKQNSQTELANRTRKQDSQFESSGHERLPFACFYHTYNIGIARDIYRHACTDDQHVSLFNHSFLDGPFGAVMKKFLYIVSVFSHHRAYAPNQ